jgi:hypothetical protein
MNADKIFKKISIFLILMLIFAGKICAFELFQFSVAPKYAVQNGQMNEYVMYANGHTQSELQWDISQINLLGFNATMGWEMLLLETNCMWGFPKSSGMLRDSDWQNTSNYGMKTNYSESDCSVDYLGNIELRVGINIKLWSFFSINPYGSISYERIEFSGIGGQYWYGDRTSTGLLENVSYNDSRAKHGNLNSYGAVITYERESFNYNLGTKVGFRFLERFSIKLDFGLSIYTAINTVDNHKVTGRSYLDKMQGFFNKYNLGLEIDVGIWKGLSAGTSFNFVKTNLIQGNDYMKKATAKKYTLDNSVLSAADGYCYNFEFFVRYSF